MQRISRFKIQSCRFWYFDSRKIIVL